MSNSTDESTKFDDKFLMENYLIGVILAVSSSIFIGCSFILKKISLNKLSENSVGAAEGGFGYLKDWLWWVGIVSMGFGEFLNLIAYGYAPASVVTPLGALSVLVSTILASKYLNEHLTTLGKVGCALCIFGSILVIFNAPREINTENIITMKILHQNPVIIYSVSAIIITLILMLILGPLYGHKYVLIYVSLCSLVGSFTVIASTVFALTIRGLFLDEYVSFEAFMITFLILVTCASIQIVYLNKALDIFGPLVVTPVYYVTFTSLVLFSTAILLDEWKQMTLSNTVGTLTGILVAFLAIFLLHKKESDVKTHPLLKNNQSSFYSGDL